MLFCCNCFVTASIIVLDIRRNLFSNPPKIFLHIFLDLFLPKYLLSMIFCMFFFRMILDFIHNIQPHIFQHFFSHEIINFRWIQKWIYWHCFVVNMVFGFSFETYASLHARILLVEYSFYQGNFSYPSGKRILINGIECFFVS